MKSPDRCWMCVRGRTVALLAALCLSSAAADTGGVSLSPLRVDLDAGHRSAAVSVRNSTQRRYRFQVEMLRWMQTAEGTDEFTPATGLLANPPLFQLDPGAEQIVRIGLLGAQPAATEASFRVYFTEIPQPAKAEGGVLNVLLRLGIPLFVAPTAGARPAMEWTARVRHGELLLQAHNRGNVHGRHAQLRVLDGERGTVLHSEAGFHDILPGSSWAWRFPLSSPAPATVKIESNTHESRDSVVVRVDRP